MSVCISENMDHLHDPIGVINVYVVMIVCVCILSWLQVVLTQCGFCAVL